LGELVSAKGFTIEKAFTTEMFKGWGGLVGRRNSAWGDSFLKRGFPWWVTFSVTSLPQFHPERQYPKKSFLGLLREGRSLIFCICFKAGKGLKTLPIKEIVSSVSFHRDLLGHQMAPSV
jgi:hypothetical protein